MWRMLAVQPLKTEPHRMCIIIACQMFGIVEVILQANTRELAWLPDQEWRNAMTVGAKRIVLPSADTLSVPTPVFVTHTSRPTAVATGGESVQ
jgi:hypothetical protein